MLGKIESIFLKIKVRGIISDFYGQEFHNVVYFECTKCAESLLLKYLRSVNFCSFPMFYNVLINLFRERVDCCSIVTDSVHTELK